MPDPSTYRPSPGSIPESPGVYRFRDSRGTVIYVGKAKNLRNRLNSYFADPSGLHPRTYQMVTSAAKVDWVVVTTEVEALQLEYSWIKEYDPRFNVRYRDDKSYPSLAVTLYEEYPQLRVMRGPKKKGVRYFGPYAHAWAIRETLDLLLRVFPARTCSAGVFKRAGQIGRPCLLGYIDKCSAPCVGRVSADEHRQIVEDFCDFMAGKTDQMLRRLEREMQRASEELEFEKAARLRDDIGALRRAMEKQAVVFGDGTDADVIAFADDGLEAAVQVFHVRGGRVRGQRGWVVEKVEDLGVGDLVEQFCLQIYGGDEVNEAVPREVLVPELPTDARVLEELLSELRGTRVALRVPQRGDKKALMDTVKRNAEQAFTQHKLKRASDLTARSKALQEIQDALLLDEAPLRIECYDISHVSGTDVVGSMVVFEDGLARKSEYRRFAVRNGPDGPPDDTAALAQVLRRRFNRYLDAHAETGDLPDEEGETTDRGVPIGIDPSTGKPRKFAYPPNLVVVDGGAPQVAAAARVLAELGIDDVALCGLAKRLEEVWLPGDDFPLVLPRTSEGLYLLQRARDEAHRFAITYHRQKRSKRMTVSALDGVAGLGETRRKALLRHFGSLKRLREASVDEIMTVPGIGRRTAETIVAALSGDSTSGDSASGDSTDAVPAARTPSEASGERHSPEKSATRAAESRPGAPESRVTSDVGVVGRSEDR
ncbi:excinuclease ABC subunit UvrC [Cryptosporangium phraense]|uniref:UvrABC system protein C n=1 Tax=Cryptosporangium phraense TaxID=2593070 RepID=A0A545ATC7_9ACTN|nr:excinuclease ABC subunit UvrC [Cryptosporangium phraense]TQS44590.1 excinuclease ABC subunit UvrC [Cryptosporangium phraense]